MSDELLTAEEICRLCPDGKECGNRGAKCNYIALKFIAQAQLAKCESLMAQKITEARKDTRTELIGRFSGMVDIWNLNPLPKEKLLPILTEWIKDLRKEYGE